VGRRTTHRNSRRRFPGRRTGTSPSLPESGVSRYYAARATDSAPLAAGDQHEKFLFYRGVGRFPVPLTARVSDDGRVALEKAGSDTIPLALLFENRGGRMGYRLGGAVEKTLTLDAPILDGSFAQLRHELESALVAQGLFPKEAQAMLETWRDSWFEEGSRLIYIVPAHAVDTILPLEIEPATSQTTRVFVGRIELLTAETRRAVASAIDNKDWLTVDRYSRFLDPILHRIYGGDAAKVSDIENFYRKIQGNGCR